MVEQGKYMTVRFQEDDVPLKIIKQSPQEKAADIEPVIQRSFQLRMHTPQRYNELTKSCTPERSRINVKSQVHKSTVYFKRFWLREVREETGEHRRIVFFYFCKYLLILGVSKQVRVQSRG